MFSRIGDYSLDFYSLAAHFPYYKVKLVSQLKRLDFSETQYGGSDSSMADQIEGGLGIAGGFVGGLAIGIYVSVLLAFTIAAVPVILYVYNYYKHVQTKGQKDNLSSLMNKMEEAEKKTKIIKIMIKQKNNWFRYYFFYDFRVVFYLRLVNYCF